MDDGCIVTVGVGQDDAAVEAGGAGPDDEALAHEVGGEAEAAGGVVVAGGQDHPGALGQAAQRLIEEGDGVIGRDGAVIDVPSDEDGVDRLGGDELDEMVGEGGVRVIEHAPVEGASQVPVGGVEDPHADTVSQPTDIYFLCLMIVEDDRIRVGQRKNRCPHTRNVDAGEKDSVRRRWCRRRPGR